MHIVLDTNVIVSALWSPNRKPGEILSAVIHGRFPVCYDYRILEEYERVLHYPKFGFREQDIRHFLDPIIKEGYSIAAPVSNIPFADEADRKFYEVASFSQAILVTGNLKHFPKEDFILSVSEFYERYL